MRAIRFEKIAQLKITEFEILVLLVDELKQDSKRVDYVKLAEMVGCSRNTVKNNVEKLVDAGLIGKADGKLSVLSDIFVELPAG